jgi:hypothetical protein
LSTTVCDFEIQELNEKGCRGKLRWQECPMRIVLIFRIIPAVRATAARRRRASSALAAAGAPVVE